MPQSRNRSRTPRPVDIDPALVDICSSKPKRGRSITLTATIRNYDGKAVEKFKLTVSKDTAVRLEKDMLWHAANVATFHKSDLIRNSVLGDMLATAIGPPESTPRQFYLSCIREGIEEFGPWIVGFVDRVSGTKPPAKDDALLLKKLLAEAKQLGYEKGIFYYRNQRNRILKSTLTAFLIEFCLGGAEGWRYIHLFPPLKLSLMSIQKKREKPPGKEIAPLNIFRHYLGADYKRKLKHPKKLIVVPPSIRNLQ